MINTCKFVLFNDLIITQELENLKEIDSNSMGFFPNINLEIPVHKKNDKSDIFYKCIRYVFRTPSNS